MSTFSKKLPVDHSISFVVPSKPGSEKHDHLIFTIFGTVSRKIFSPIFYLRKSQN